MLLYETLYAISTYSPQEVLFKGGTMISRVYIAEPIRFSWDLDFEGKGMCSFGDVNNFINDLNKKLQANGGIVEMKIGPYEFSLGLFEIDEEKYIPEKFPNLIPIKRTLPALTLGAELPSYLRKVHSNLRDSEVTADFIKIRKLFGGMLHVEDVRGEINVGGAPYREKAVSIKSLLEPEKQPIKSVSNQLVPILEEVLADKIDSISKPLVPEKMVDLVKDIFDVSFLFRIGYDPKLVNARLRTFVREREDVNSLKNLYVKAKKNTEEMKFKGDSIFHQHHLFEPARNQVKWQDLCDLAISHLVKSTGHV